MLPIAWAGACGTLRSTHPTIKIPMPDRYSRTGGISIVVLGLELELAEIGHAGLDGDRLAVASGGTAAPADRLVPDLEAVLPGRGVLDLEVAVLIRDEEVRVIKDRDPAVHPRVDVARH